MRNKFIQLTSGWIPVSVLLLFTAALVMGQGVADPEKDAGQFDTPAVPVLTPGLLDPNDQARLESIRGYVDAVLPLPETLEATIKAASRTAADPRQPRVRPVE